MSGSSRIPARTRDEKKSAVADKKADVEMDSTQKSGDDVYEFKMTKEGREKSPEKSTTVETTDADTKATPMESSSNRPATQMSASPPVSQTAEEGKRTFSEMSEPSVEEASLNADEELRRKKSRKEECSKDTKSGGLARSSKPVSTNTSKTQASSVVGKTCDSSSNRKSPVDSPKSTAASSDVETDESKSDLKVPPLKIVIPQSSTNEQETGTSRNGKANSQRAHAALPYVVPSNSEGEKESTSDNSPVEAGNGKDDKKDANNSNGEEHKTGSSGGHHQRVLRSHRGGGPQTDRSSNNSSPQLQRSHSPSPTASPVAPATAESPSTAHALAATTSKSSDSQTSNGSDTEPSSCNAPSTSSAPVELHPRKRKMKQNKESSTPSQSNEPLEPSAVSEVHPHEQPIMNCYQLFLNIRKQIDKRRRDLFPVQPKPPQGFKDYLMNRCTYVLAGTAPTAPNITYPANLMPQMKDLFAEQEKERYKLRMQHVIEKEKLVLSVEQEILRVHGRAARALANQSLPFSVCTVLRDEEVYNLITPEQEEKDRNARSRYNGRLFLSWLQDIDDKWEKIKEHMLLRHHNEAESLYAVQKMDWEWKLKELSLCDAKSVPYIDELYVPMVHVSDDFDLP